MLCMQCLRTNAPNLLRASARSARSDALIASAFLATPNGLFTRLQTSQRTLVTSVSAAIPTAPQDVVSERHKPGFKPQNQEFIGTVMPPSTHIQGGSGLSRVLLEPHG